MRATIVILVLFECLAWMPRAAAAPSPDRECATRLDAIAIVPLGGPAVDGDPALAWFIADPSRNNDACLQSALSDTSLRPNPFDPESMPNVTRSEVALFVLAKARGFHRSTCFPDALLEARHEGALQYHQWFLRKDHADQLAARCRAVVKAWTMNIVVPSPTDAITVQQGAFPRWSCIAALKQVRDSAQLRRRFAGMSRSEAGCMIEAIDSGELVRTPDGVSTSRVVSVSELALLALFQGTDLDAVKACDPAATDDDALIRDFEDKLPNPGFRKQLRACLLQRLGMNDRP